MVVKRADDGPKVGKPAYQIASSKIVRFDVYVGVQDVQGVDNDAAA